VGDSNIAEVAANGKVTAKAYVKGTNTTTLTISIEGTSISKTINITVNKEIIIPPPPVATSIEASDISITENKTSNVNAVVKDQFDNIMNGGYTLKYSVGDSNIAEVEANGKVTAKDYVEGTNTTTLTISIEGTSISKTINIKVNKEIIIPPPTVATSVEASDISITENKISNVNAVVKDQFDNIMNSGYTLKYSVGDSNIAEVDASGKVTAKAYLEGTNITTLTISIEGISISK
ncbi:hypothetical protein, partial [Clostridium gasigenes]|uniref:hypothetical protein n=1 Tax=Clostridium gasigenes TaxID=94869 RepID=UPI001C0BDA6B